MNFKTLIFLLIIILSMAILPGRSVLAGSPPVAENDAYSTLINDNLSIDAPGVLENDFDPDGDPLNAILVDSSQGNGNLFLFPDGSFEYEPAPGFTGVDIFTYVANDGEANSNEATIEFTVTGTNLYETYTDQTLFLDELAAQGFKVWREGFEDDAVWGDVRTTIVGGQRTTPYVKNLGVTWTSNNNDSEVTTGEGPAFRGQWGFFSLPHGSYTSGQNCHLPINCGDGWQGHSEVPLVAIGGWVETNTPYAGLNMYLDGNMDAPIDFNDVVLGTQYQFFGLIALDGFNQFEYREIEGTMDDAKYIFGDNFFFAYIHNQTIWTNRMKMKILLQGARIGARIGMVDQDGNPAAGANISAQWIYPDGSINPVTGQTNSAGRAQWIIQSQGPGDYTLEILDISLPDHVYVGGLTSRTITNP